MFPYNDPHTMLELHRRRAAELTGRAAARRLARDATPGRVSRFGRWPRRRRCEQPATAPAAA